MKKLKKLKKLNAWSNNNTFSPPKSAQGYLLRRVAGEGDGHERKKAAGKPSGGSCGIACSGSEEE